jgi:hypothetical protein
MPPSWVMLAVAAIAILLAAPPLLGPTRRLDGKKLPHRLRKTT